jgi:hypothetical protein
MTKLINSNKYNALKHGVSSEQGLLPNEKATDYAALEAKWRGGFQPHHILLENIFTGMVHNRWQRIRSRQATAKFASLHPFGRAVAEAAGGGGGGGGDWDETARKLLSDLDTRLKTLEQAAESLTTQAANTENAADKKRLSKAADKLANAAQRIANQHDMAMEFFLGIGDETRKQADRDADLDAKLNKLLTSYFQYEQMLATRDKQLPQKSRQSSADAHDFINELPEKLEPKAVCPIPENKALPDPKKDDFDLDDWGTTPSKH